MRMLKKLLLAGAFIGVLGSFGFAQEAKAAPTVTDIAFNNGNVTVTVSGDSISSNKIRLKLEGVQIGEDKSITDGKAVFDGIKNLVHDKQKVSATTFTKGTLSNLSVDIVSGNVVTPSGVTKTMSPSLYKLEATAVGGGTVTVDGDTVLRIYDYAQGTGLEKTGGHTLVATGGTEIKFDGWTGGSTEKTKTALSGIYAKENDLVYQANFSSKYNFTAAELGVSIYSSQSKSSTLISEYDTVNDSYGSMKRYQYMLLSIYEYPTGVADYYYSCTLKFEMSDSSSASKYIESKSKGWYYAKAVTPEYETLDITLLTEVFTDEKKENKIWSDTSSTISITIENNDTPTPVTDGRIDLDGFKDYITEGYTLEFTAKATDTSLDLSNFEWIASTGGDYFDSYSMEATSNNVKYEKKVKLKFKDEKLEKGTNSQEVKVKCRYKGTTNVFLTIGNDTDTEKKITVYSNPTNSYNNSDRTMSYKVPAKVNTGTESGKDSNMSYTTEKPISEVTGIRLNILLSDKEIGYTNQKGTNATLSTTTMETMVKNLADKNSFTGDCTITLRAYPSDSNGNCNKKVYHDTYAKVYKVVLRPGQSATAGAKTASAYALPIAMIAQRNTGATATTTAAGKEYVLYGLEGQELSIPADVGDVLDSDGNKVAKLKVYADTSKNVYRYTPSSTAEGLDKVPKTGQSNVFVYVMAVVVCGAVGYGLYVYNKKSKRSI